MNILVDSDIVIEVLRARNQTILEQWQAFAASESSILISPITIAEIGAGARSSEKDAIARLFAPLTCVPILEETGQRAGEYLRLYAKSHNLEMADALIAASAVESGARLWTRNRKHYPMPKLTVYA